MYFSKKQKLYTDDYKLTVIKINNQYFFLLKKCYDFSNFQSIPIGPTLQVQDIVHKKTRKIKNKSFSKKNIKQRIRHTIYNKLYTLSFLTSKIFQYFSCFTRSSRSMEMSFSSNCSSLVEDTELRPSTSPQPTSGFPEVLYS